MISLRLTIQMKAVEQYFLVVMFIVLAYERRFKVLCPWTKSSSVTIKIKDIEKYFHVMELLS